LLPTRSLQNLIIGLIVTGILLLALGGYLTPLARIFLAPLISIQTWLSERYNTVQTFINTPRDVALLTQENLELKAEIARLQAQNIDLQQQNAEIQILSALLDFASAHPEPTYLTAQVIGRDASPFMQYVFINRGSDDGLRRGMPVVNQQGLVGRIAAVTARAARVQLITDPGVSINIRFLATDAEAILTGSITGDILLDLIPQDVAVQPGDLVLTSGLGGSYPPNILIGQVSTVRQRPFDLFQTASVQPVVDFGKVDIVLVVTNFQPVDITPLEPTPRP
jgi:rod shape-determining protein MreC